jgi:ribosomal protein S18 acetylase RimI-like enzyme
LRFRIRRAGLEDMDVIGDLWDLMLQEGQNNMPALLPNAREVICNFWSVGVLTGNASAYIAEIDGPVGFIAGQIVTPDPPFAPLPYGYITALYLRPEFRRKKLGQLLYNSLSKMFYKKGIKRIEVHVYPDNTQGHHFWRSIGLKPIGCRLGIGVSALIKDTPEHDGGSKAL